MEKDNKRLPSDEDSTEKTGMLKSLYQRLLNKTNNKDKGENPESKDPKDKELKYLRRRVRIDFVFIMALIGIASASVYNNFKLDDIIFKLIRDIDTANADNKLCASSSFKLDELLKKCENNFATQNSYTETAIKQRNEALQAVKAFKQALPTLVDEEIKRKTPKIATDSCADLYTKLTVTEEEFAKNNSIDPVLMGKCKAAVRIANDYQLAFDNCNSVLTSCECSCDLSR